MISHDPDSLWRVADEVAFLGDGQVLAMLPMAQLIKEGHPLIQEYFSCDRMVVERRGTDGR